MPAAQQLYRGKVPGEREGENGMQGKDSGNAPEDNRVIGHPDTGGTEETKDTA